MILVMHPWQNKTTIHFVKKGKFMTKELTKSNKFVYYHFYDLDFFWLWWQVPNGCFILKEKNKNDNYIMMIHSCFEVYTKRDQQKGVNWLWPRKCGGGREERRILRRNKYKSHKTFYDCFFFALSKSFALLIYSEHQSLWCVLYFLLLWVCRSWREEFYSPYEK